MHLPDVRWADCLVEMRTMPDNSIDSIVTDPPYGLAEHKRADIELALSAWLSGDREHVPTGKGGFMGKDWDRFVPPPAVWDECFRVLKPGGHLLAFCGTRTFDLMAMSIRLARIGANQSPEIRDSIAWMYGSGFPKSRDIGKAIDTEAGVVREVAGTKHRSGAGNDVYDSRPSRQGRLRASDDFDITAPATEAARQWDGWGTAMKPAFEPIIVARKPLDQGTVAANVLRWGTGGINVDGCRIGTDERTYRSTGQPGSNAVRMRGDDGRDAENARRYGERSKERPPTTVTGRWPANVILDEAMAAALDEQSGTLTSGYMKPETNWATQKGAAYGEFSARTATETYGDSGGASRFMYCAKAPKKERPSYTKADGTVIAHPTVKPLSLMRWLVRLVTPPGGTVLDPFPGSGTTLEAAMLEGFPSIGIEKFHDYLPLIMLRMERVIAQRS